MIALDRYDTVRLLITKGWKHKDVPKKSGESIIDYSKRVFANQCGTDLIRDADVAIIWMQFAEEFWEKMDFVNFMNAVIKGERSLFSGRERH